MDGKEIGEMDERFWELVRLLGYPTSERGLTYGSKQHKTLQDIENLWSYMKTVHFNGPNALKWGNILYRSLASRYPLAYYAGRIALGEGVKEQIRKDTKENYAYIRHLHREVSQNLRELEDWVKNGGKVSADSLREAIRANDRVYRICECRAMSDVQSIREHIDRDFNTEVLEKILLLLRESEAKEEDIEAIRDEFLRIRERSERLYNLLVRRVKRLADKNGISTRDLPL